MQRGPVFPDSNRGIGSEYFNRGSGTFNHEPDRQEKGKNNDSKASVSLQVRASQALTLWISVNMDTNFRLGGQKQYSRDYRQGWSSCVYIDLHEILLLETAR